MRKPKIKVINVSESDSKDFLTTFIEQNVPSALDGDIKILHEYKSKYNKGNTVNLLIELSPDIYRVLISKGDKIHIGWSSYRFFEFVSVIRCYRCWRYGHFADKCKAPESCPLCGENHKKEQCKKVDNFVCVNCKYANETLKLKDVSFNHHVFDINCSSYQKQISKEKEKINYNS